MAKAMPKELTDGIKSVLDTLMEPDRGAIEILYEEMNEYPSLRTTGAVGYLEDLGVLEPTRNRLRVTAYGREYYAKLTAPRMYWFKQNWFPAIVAAATIAASVGGIVANVLE